MVALKWTMENEFGVKPGEVFWAASDVGWVVGHSYIVYGAAAAWLHHRSCSRASRSARPTPAPTGASSPSTAWWRCSPRRPRSAPSRGRTRDGEHVAQLRPFEFPHAVPGRRARRPRHHQMGRAEAQGAGDRPLVADRDRLADDAATRPASACCRSNTARPACRCPATTSACSTTPASRCRAGTLGNVVVKLPLPPGCLPTLWNADERFRQAYLDEFPGYYKTADAGLIDEDGYLFVMARTDDIINVAGHRLSTGAMEEVLSAHPDVAECAVIGIADAMKGQVPLRLRRAQCRRRARRRHDRARGGRRWCANASARSPPSRRW